MELTAAIDCCPSSRARTYGNLSTCSAYSIIGSCAIFYSNLTARIYCNAANNRICIFSNNGSAITDNTTVYCTIIDYEITTAILIIRIIDSWLINRCAAGPGNIPTGNN
ncbi:hypothetical protein Amal_03865 [Acetobacter malorum]|uniref:Uncharacterized protein n=1 Tax=Acetobacter malorum TaxID=178901 RepID=A0A177G6V5_9PROT|nr:hypothetical protein Amal_03865 [Acetobacter malorum]